MLIIVGLLGEGDHQARMAPGGGEAGVKTQLVIVSKIQTNLPNPNKGADPLPTVAITHQHIQIRTSQCKDTAWKRGGDPAIPATPHIHAIQGVQ
jgi:hypothetical protein